MSKGKSANESNLEAAGAPYLISIDNDGNAERNFQNYLGSPSTSNHYKVNLNLSNVKRGTNVDPLSEWLTSAGIFTKDEPQRYDFLCAETMLPGTSVETFTELGSRQGIEEFFPVRKIYADLSMTFYVSSDYKVVRLLQEWMNFINPINDPLKGKVTGASPTGYAGLRDTTAFHRHRYPVEYRREIAVTKFERDYSSRIMFIFLNAFPVNINSIALSYDEATVTKVTVDFKYDRYVMVNFPEDGTSQPLVHQSGAASASVGELASVSTNPMDGRAPWDWKTPSPFFLGDALNLATDYTTLKDLNSPLLNWPT
tara:strand:+ start:453 stop:1388 length:936 start_codon:yes stop_codon:yes gene_type:complete